MAKFEFLYSGGNHPETEAEQAKMMQVWTDWFTDLGSAVADPGNPFGPVAKKISNNGVVGDNPVGVMFTGYSIISADSFDQAVKIAQSCPGLHDGTEVSVFEIMEVMS